jgi:hypothetical protein
MANSPNVPERPLTTMTMSLLWIDQLPAHETEAGEDQDVVVPIRR